MLKKVALLAKCFELGVVLFLALVIRVVAVPYPHMTAVLSRRILRDLIRFRRDVIGDVLGVSAAAEIKVGRCPQIGGIGELIVNRGELGRVDRRSGGRVGLIFHDFTSF